VAGATRVTVPSETLLTAARELKIPAERVTYGVELQRCW
jgi:hypothetical protein